MIKGRLNIQSAIQTACYQPRAHTFSTILSTGSRQPSASQSATAAAVSGKCIGAGLGALQPLVQGVGIEVMHHIGSSHGLQHFGVRCLFYLIIQRSHQ